MVWLAMLWHWRGEADWQRELRRGVVDALAAASERLLCDAIEVGESRRVVRLLDSRHIVLIHHRTWSWSTSAARDSRELMSSIVRIVAAICLVAASSERPVDRDSDQVGVAQLKQATQAVVCAATRRDAPACEARLPPLTIVVTQSFDEPPDVVWRRSEATAYAVPLARPRTVSSRGPPRG